MDDSQSIKSFTGRLILKPLSARDDTDVALLISHPIIHHYLPYRPKHNTIDDARKRRETRASNDAILDFSIHLKNGDVNDEHQQPSVLDSEFAGLAGFTLIDSIQKSCDMFISVRPELHRQGIATEALHAVLRLAFDEMKMHRVSIRTAMDNAPMRGWLENAAKASWEGCLRGAITTGPGSWTDVALYGILESDWQDYVRPSLEGRMDKGE